MKSFLDAKKFQNMPQILFSDTVSFWMFGCFGLIHQTRWSFSACSSSQSSGMIIQNFKHIFNFFSVYYSSLTIFKNIFRFSSFEHCVFVKKYSKTLISFSVTKRKDSICNPETSTGSAIALSM